MEKAKSDAITLKCCACDRETMFWNGSDIYTSAWGLHETKDKRIDLCPSCAKRQDGREEQERQILGLPPQKIEPMKKNSDIQREIIKDAVKPVGTSGITVRARFKLESIDVVVGDTLISGDIAESKEITLPMSGSDLKIGSSYHLNLI